MMPGAEKEPPDILAVTVRSFYLESILLETFPNIVLEVTKPVNTTNLENLLGLVPVKYKECDYVFVCNLQQIMLFYVNSTALLSGEVYTAIK